MEEYASNSNKSRERAAKPPEKRVERVASGTVRKKHRTALDKVADVFIPEDVENVKDYILNDIVVPSAKNLILDTVQAFLGVNTKNSVNRSPASRVSYRKYYDDNQRTYVEPRSRVGYDYSEIEYADRGEAENVLDSMDEAISVYGFVSVLDYYDLSGVTTDNYANDKYGWTNLRSARIVRLPSGRYSIKLPRARALSNN